jgi:hypothetical protein
MTLGSLIFVIADVAATAAAGAAAGAGLWECLQAAAAVVVVVVVVVVGGATAGSADSAGDSEGGAPVTRFGLARVDTLDGGEGEEDLLVVDCMVSLFAWHSFFGMLGHLETSNYFPVHFHRQ